MRFGHVSNVVGMLPKVGYHYVYKSYMWGESSLVAGPFLESGPRDYGHVLDYFDLCGYTKPRLALPAAESQMQVPQLPAGYVILVLRLQRYEVAVLDVAPTSVAPLWQPLDP